MKTNETTHTPGPWKTYGLAIYTEAKRKHWVSPRDPRLSLIGNARDNDPEDPEAVDYNSPEYAEAAANAALMASAPELLEALEDCAWMVKDKDPEAYAKARAAIAKARGLEGGGV